MAHTDARSQQLGQGTAAWETPVLVCLGLLPYPYVMFAGLVGLFALGIRQTFCYPIALLKLLHRQGLLALTVLLLVSASVSANPGEAFLQLVHFIPFFWLWAVLVLYLQRAIAPWQQLYRWALVLVLTAIPINLIGIGEYILKQRQVFLGLLARFPIIDWIYIGDSNHPRTFSVFDYPNTLASYLVMVLGLTIGLVFLRREEPFPQKSPGWLRGLLAANILLTLACLYCSGSRNGYLVAAVLLLAGLTLLRTHRWIKLLGLASLGIIVVTTLRFGLAGRSLSSAWITDDPRVYVWQLALNLIRERPVLGHGLGNYKLLYNGEVPGYDYIAHAHNFWLTMASEAGLPVAIGFTLAVGFMGYRGLRGLHQIKASPNHYTVLMGYHLCFLGITLFSLLDLTLFEARVNVLSWLSLAVIYCAPDLSRVVNRPSTKSASPPAGQSTAS